MLAVAQLRTAPRGGQPPVDGVARTVHLALRADGLVGLSRAGLALCIEVWGHRLGV